LSHHAKAAAEKLEHIAKLEAEVSRLEGLLTESKEMLEAMSSELRKYDAIAEPLRRIHREEIDRGE
jgi:hypothetical protein